MISTGIGGVIELSTPVTTVKNGYYFFDYQDIAAELSLPHEVSNMLYQVQYDNPDPTDTDRLMKWTTGMFPMSIYSAGTVISTFDIAGLPTPSHTEIVAPLNLPVTFAWVSRIVDDSEYYLWFGCNENGSCRYESDLDMHPANTATLAGDTFLGGTIDLEDIAQWRVRILSYAGTGDTNLFPLYN